MGPSSADPLRNVLDVLIDDQSTATGSSTYLLDARSTRTLSFAQLAESTASNRRRLQAEGLIPGSRVGVVIADPLSFATWFLAGLACGLWVAPLDPTVRGDRLLQHDVRGASLRLSAVLSDQAAPPEASLRWIDTTGDVSGAVSASTTDAAITGGVLLSSSGTTGTPKVMALPLAQLLTNAHLIARHNELSVGDRGFNALPLWHVNAEVVGLLATLSAGSSLVLDERFHRTGFWKIVDDFEVTWINAVPAIISRLSVLHDDESVPGRIRFVRSASAPLSPLLCADFESTIGIAVIESYGMTEAASQICASPLGGVRKPGSAGVAVGAQVRIVPFDDQDAEGPKVGHIEIKGPTVITSYESDAYADRFDGDGWLRTGDLGHVDDDGYLFIVGRSDDVINRGGEKIYPLEIENVLASVEGVAAVVVIGEPDDVFGRVPVAYVSPSNPETLDDEVERAELVRQLRRLATDSFSRASRPVSVKFVVEFPSHATGKIRRGSLREGGVDVRYEERL